jgi:site-specific recombinase XerD
MSTAAENCTLGHAQVTSTELFTHVGFEDLKEVVRREHPHGRKLR